MADVPPGNRTTAADARRWLAAMPARVGGQRRLLESLIAAAEAAPAFRWLELGGSLARGAGDELSDIDDGSLARREHQRPGEIVGEQRGRPAIRACPASLMPMTPRPKSPSRTSGSRIHTS
jgi:hypothetical protein